MSTSHASGATWQNDGGLFTDWPSHFLAPNMASSLLSEHGRLLTHKKDVVKLGAGVGNPYILLDRLSASQ